MRRRRDHLGRWLRLGLPDRADLDLRGRAVGVHPAGGSGRERFPAVVSHPRPCGTRGDDPEPQRAAPFGLILRAAPGRDFKLQNGLHQLNLRGCAQHAPVATFALREMGSRHDYKFQRQPQDVHPLDS